MNNMGVGRDVAYGDTVIDSSQWLPLQEATLLHRRRTTRPVLGLIIVLSHVVRGTKHHTASERNGAPAGTVSIRHVREED